jgi:hypothetical protein
MGALWSLFAAALDARIQSAVCESGLLSFRSLCRTDRYLHGASVFVRNILLEFDLPQVAAAVAGRSLTLASPVDAMKNPVELRWAEAEYRWARDAYKAAGVPELLRITTG